MKQIHYSGSSKLISRIVHLLNRKAPLPLDGDGDPAWGSNGQVLTSDGSGSTYWSAGGGGGGDTVSWTQTQASGTKIAEIDINGTSQDVYTPPVPTKTSDLTNDSGFITSADLPTAGDGIDIANNVISLVWFSVVNGELCQVYDDGQ